MAPDRAGTPLSGRRRACRTAGFGTAAAAVLAWCGWVSGYHRSTAPAEVTWTVSLAAVVAVDIVLWRRLGRGGGTTSLVGPWPSRQPWPRPGRGGAGPALVGTLPWLALVIVALAWEILGLDTGRHVAHLTISALAQAYRPLNAALLLVWIGVGIAYGVITATRPSAPADGSRPPTPAGGDRPAGQLATWPVAPVVALGALGRTAGHGTVAPVTAPARLPALLLPHTPVDGVAFWLAWVAAWVVVDQAARRSAARVPTFDEFLRFITRPAWANTLLVVAWAYAGWHLFAR